jgi:hypothetical protein
MTLHARVQVSETPARSDIRFSAQIFGCDYGAAGQTPLTRQPSQGRFEGTVPLLEHPGCNPRRHQEPSASGVGSSPLGLCAKDRISASPEGRSLG